MATSPVVDAAALRVAREQAGLTQAEVARRAGLAGGERVSVWERGLAVPRNPTVLHAVASALNVRPTSLLVPPSNGPNLRWLRFAAGLTVEEFAQAAHTSVPTIKRWEAHGVRRQLPGRTIQNLAEALGVTPQVVTSALRS